ncbi:hypothetical protein [Chryseobacterium sp. RU37D]|nr:hypothetical protein [Chryseobacterium sp. RU37D]
MELFPAFHYNLFFQKRIFIAIGARVVGQVASRASATTETHDLKVCTLKK